jgi:hypothetical protein
MSCDLSCPLAIRDLWVIAIRQAGSYAVFSVRGAKIYLETGLYPGIGRQFLLHGD